MTPRTAEILAALRAEIAMHDEVAPTRERERVRTVLFLEDVRALLELIDHICPRP